MQSAFKNPDEAFNFLWPFTSRLAFLLLWSLVGMALLLALWMALALLWAFQVQPASVWAGLHSSTLSTTGAVLGSAGLSIAAAAGAYGWVLTKAVRAIAKGPLFDWLSAPALH